MEIIRPFIKCGKRNRTIRSELVNFAPKEFKNYYEPFLGSGSLFFSLYPRINRAFLSSNNPEIANTYLAVQKHLPHVIRALQEHADQSCKKYYYSLRAQKPPEDIIEAAARFIYLLRTSSNGIYCTDKQAKFNNSMGVEGTVIICPEELITKASVALQQKAYITKQPYWSIEPAEGDFVYLDPPFYGSCDRLIANNSVLPFKEDEHIQLRNFALRMMDRGVKVMISNSCNGFVRELYSKSSGANYFYIERLPMGGIPKDGKLFFSENVITSYKVTVATKKSKWL